MESKADTDIRYFKMFSKHEITFESLRKIICENNCLELYFRDGKIPADMMLNELRLTGWISEDRYRRMMHG